MKEATIRSEQASDNPRYMTYVVIDDSTDKKCTHTERVHKSEDPTEAIKRITAKAQERGYHVKNDPRWTHGE